MTSKVTDDNTNFYVLKWMSFRHFYLFQLFSKNRLQNERFTEKLSVCKSFAMIVLNIHIAERSTTMTSFLRSS